MRLTKEELMSAVNQPMCFGSRLVGKKMFAQIIKELCEYKTIEEKLGIDLITFLKGIDPNTCFMEVTKDKKFYLCGDAYYGNYSKEELLKLIQELLFMYWALTKEELL